MGMWQVNDGIWTQDTGFIVTSFSSPACSLLSPCQLPSADCAALSCSCWEPGGGFLTHTLQSHRFLPAFTASLLLIQKTTLVENVILESVAPFYLVFFFCVSVSLVANCFTDVPPEIVASLGFCPWLSFSHHFSGVICSVIKFSTACIYVCYQICTFSSHVFLTPWLALCWVS